MMLLFEPLWILITALLILVVLGQGMILSKSYINPKTIHKAKIIVEHEIDKSSGFRSGEP
jgi:hypothetical protein